MGRTATAFLMLLAVGGCVAGDKGMDQFAIQQTAVPPSYAKWARPGDPAAPTHDGAAGPQQAVAASPAQQPNTTTAQKPVPSPKAEAAKPPSPAPAPAASSSGQLPVVVDSQLAAATMVTLPADKASAEPVKSPPAPAHCNLDADKPAGDHGAPDVRMVNSKRITLNFELKDVGASGVAGVELWCKQDNQPWKKGEIVAQTSRSFTVEVKEEGLYGFTLLARNGSGLGKDAPGADEPPQVLVMVDVTKPTVQISSVDVNAAAGKTPTVEIHWTAKDKNLGSKPITLSYAEQPEGPWTPIAAGVENSGQHEWQPPATAPQRVFLKVDAVDLPGNMASAQTANPLRLDAGDAVVVPPPADATHAAKTLPAPPALDVSQPSAAISGVVPSGN